MTKVLVCGGRDYQNRARIHQVLDAAVERLGVDAVVQGGATGADLLAKEWAIALKLQCETFHADWRGLGAAAGPIRNKRMLEEGKPDVVIAFPTPGEPNKGTNGMIKLARDAGLTVHVIDADGDMGQSRGAA
jgi:hypothetical protein